MGRSTTAMDVLHYVDADGRDHFGDWWQSLRDKKAMAAIDQRIMRMESGNFGDCKFLRDGVWELRIDVGPGYRVYYAKDGLTLILLLCGGDKRKQNSDIGRACGFWNEWRQRRGRDREDAQ